MRTALAQETAGLSQTKVELNQLVHRPSETQINSGKQK
jgi:hypothetical protein